MKIVRDLGHSALTFLCPGLRETHRRRGGRSVKVREDEAYKKQTAKISKSTGYIDDVHITYFLTETEATYT